MARIRSIKPEYWSSAQVMECSRDARLLFIGMWNFCDDAGRISDSPRQIKALVFPGDDISPDEMSGLIGELSANDLLLRYVVEGKAYIQITGWHHQKIDKPQKPKCPGPFAELSPNGRDGEERIREKEGKGTDEQEEVVISNIGSFVRSLEPEGSGELFSAAEISTLALTFDLLDIPSILPELIDWCAGKGIARLGEQKSAIYGALQKRQQKLEATRNLIAASVKSTDPPLSVSLALANSRLLRGRH